MFIVSTSNGKTFKEQDLTWDQIPTNVEITQIQLTFPFKVTVSETENYAPLLSIGQYDAYYFSNEAIMKIPVTGSLKVDGAGESSLQAKIVGGIDNKNKIVIQTRLDRSGNATISRFSLQRLKEQIKEDTFKVGIIRNGKNSNMREFLMKGGNHAV